MSTPATPSAPKPAGDARTANPAETSVAAPHLEERLRVFWERNSKVVATALVIVLLVIVGKGAWEYLQEQREQEIGKAYSAATGALQLKAFAASHAGHSLAGVATLRVADEAYADAKYTDALASYEQAAAVLKTGPLASRARLGAAMCKLQGGNPADGEAALKAFAGDAKELKTLRAEATYHLVTLSFANRRWDNVKSYSEQVIQLDPASPWAQRVITLRAQMPATELGVTATPAK